MLNPSMTFFGIAGQMPAKIRAKIDAAKSKRPASPPRSAPKSPTSPPLPRAAAREAEIALGVYVKHGRTRAQAVRALASQHPELHARWIAEVNHG